MNMKPINDGTGKLFEFNSWGSLLDYLKTPLPSDAYRTSSRDGDYEFTGTKSYDQAIDIANTGWVDGVKDAKQLADTLINKVMDKVSVPVIHYDVEGIDYDMSLVNRGIPECWYRFEEHIMDNDGDNVVTIVVNGSASCGIDKGDITKRGAVIVALIELLEYSHRKVAVVHDMSYHSDITFRTIIKTPEQPLDLARLMFACAHPSMLRRLMFRALELNPVQHRNVGASYSMPTESALNQRGDIYFPIMHYVENEKWHKNPEAFIIEQLTKQGIEVKVN